MRRHGSKARGSAVEACVIGPHLLNTVKTHNSAPKDIDCNISNTTLSTGVCRLKAHSGN